MKVQALSIRPPGPLGNPCLNAEARHIGCSGSPVARHTAPHGRRLRSGHTGMGAAVAEPASTSRTHTRKRGTRALEKRPAPP